MKTRWEKMKQRGIEKKRERKKKEQSIYIKHSTKLIEFLIRKMENEL